MAAEMLTILILIQSGYGTQSASTKARPHFPVSSARAVEEEREEGHRACHLSTDIAQLHSVGLWHRGEEIYLTYVGTLATTSTRRSEMGERAR